MSSQADKDAAEQERLRVIAEKLRQFAMPIIYPPPQKDDKAIYYPPEPINDPRDKGRTRKG